MCLVLVNLSQVYSNLLDLKRESLVEISHSATVVEIQSSPYKLTEVGVSAAAQ